ncbi:DUF3572 family protein [Paralimibaculum aggregatum]|nr:DUF3572 family protein [Limibaculum sp. NKW23]
MSRAAATELAGEVLGWLAGRPEDLADFLVASGARPEDLRAAVRQPEFLGFVLDYLLASEAMLLDCTADLGVPPDRPAAARAALPGGDLPHWT